MLLADNRTLRILSTAENEGYGVLAQACYDSQMAISLVRAAEQAQSPAIILLFPVTLQYGKGPFLRLCLDLAHQASVPIAVHLDHATDPEHLELALSLAEQGIIFDSIMVDASHAENDEENISIAKPYVDRAHKLGIAVEVEMGRLEGGEAGLRMISDAKLTDPAKAKAFMEGKDLYKEFRGKVPICLHGTDTLPDTLFAECIKNGVSKVIVTLPILININSWGRDPYARVLGEALLSKSFPEAVDIASDVLVKECLRFFDVFGSKGKA
ncbi:Putative fructose-bisphosphate aldolase [Psilocybe cubensis]|uniref:Fructose-bisphosphate aldolase n=1 Tax=Psilocybe cubensis TaxID=181762 RepID=A0ACB8GI21_PSICU|nr:Putative fructose-bisphosphate aldolase [Psilocybe cubensis]KAH9475254.1 Putative fructose-bisphosphate aldolase [Psilocybe cubensis]